MESKITYENNEYTRQEFITYLEKAKIIAQNDIRITSTVNLVEFIEGNIILDIGCNVGTLAKHMVEYGKGIVTIYAIDIVEEFIEISKEYNSDKNIYYRHLDLLNNDFPDNYFDQVIFLETIEHVENPVGFLKEIFRILKPGGSLILSTPNSLAIFRTIKNVFFMSFKTREKLFKTIEDEERNTGTQTDHIYLWDYECLFRLLNRCGFVYTNHIITKGRFIRNSILNKIAANFATTQIFKVSKPID